MRGESDRLWLIGGTQDSKILAQHLVSAGVPCVVTVTTETARSLYPCSPLLLCYVGALDTASIADFLQQYGVIGILDASHPFAVEISQLAIAAARNHALPYLRYERPEVKSDSSPAEDATETAESLLSLVASGSLDGERVLFTIGYRPLHLLRLYQDQAVLFARILPSRVALNGALAAGFTPDRLIALRPPVSMELERALWQQWGISVVVMKASGAPGGEEVKRTLAKELGIRCVAIARPAVEYPKWTSEITTALAFCKRIYHHI